MAKKNYKNTKEQGDELEDLVADLYKQNKDFNIEKRKQFPVILHEGQDKRNREVDIYISFNKSGLKFERAIECKNYKNKVGVSKVDEFIGKLEDIGLEVRNSIFVTSNGFTKDAIQKAEKRGIKTYVFEDNTAKYISDSLYESVQTETYLLLRVDKVSWKSMCKENNPFIYDSEGNLRGMFQDIVWQLWRTGKLDESVGESKEYQIKDTASLFTYGGGKQFPILEANFTYSVLALVLQIEGNTTQHTLKDAKSGKNDKWNVNVKFNIPKGEIELKTYTSEEELAKAISNRKVRLDLGRYKLPRILSNFVYWPPSASTLQKINNLDPKNPHITHEEIEGRQINSAWEPVYPFYLEALSDMAEMLKNR